MRGVIGSSCPSKDFGQTAPPPDGSLVECPTCVKGQRLIGLAQLIGCPDCFGSGVQGYGFAALHVFDSWLDDLPSDDDGDDEAGH